MSTHVAVKSAKKRTHEEAVAAAAAPVEAPEASAEDQAAKKAKKAAKKAAKLEKQQHADAMQVETAPTAAAAAAAAAAEEEEEETPVDAGAEKKKKKKKAKVAEQAAEEAEEAEQKPKAASKKALASAPTISAEGQAHRETLGISVEGEEREGVIFEPMRTFDAAPFAKDIINFCKQYKTPSPIQSQCWPIALTGRDVVGIAATGSGKTLAFTLPGVTHIKAKNQDASLKRNGPLMLVLAPTRELACQIDAVCSDVGRATNLKTICIYGGVGKDQQKQALRQGAQIVVATPGRLLDLINEGACSLANISFLVLDEADRMLDLGFEKDIRAILSNIKTKHQTLMFSATWPSSIQTLAQEFLNNPVKVIVGSQDLAASHSVKQIVEVIEQQQKEGRLHELLQDYHKSRKNRVLVFVLYKLEADRIERFLRMKGWNPGSIHGDKNQQDRTAALQAFKDGSRPLLIATDVAARGLDIPNVEFVINLTFPLTIEDYVHRIGRTGRAGAKGIAHTLFTTFDKAHSGELVNVLKEAKQPVPENLLKFGTHTKKKEHKLYGAHYKATEGEPMKAATKITFDDDE